MEFKYAVNMLVNEPSVTVEVKQTPPTNINTCDLKKSLITRYI